MLLEGVGIVLLQWLQALLTVSPALRSLHPLDVMDASMRVVHGYAGSSPLVSMSLCVLTII